MKRSLLLLSLAAAALLAGCSSFKLGTVMYCASATACEMKASPFRPADAVPVGSEGQAGSVALPVVKPAP